MLGVRCVPAFVKSDRPARYPGLRVKYVRGADPVIKLMDEEERVQEVSARAGVSLEYMLLIMGTVM